jgi:hypothetical protein
MLLWLNKLIIGVVLLGFIHVISGAANSAFSLAEEELLEEQMTEKSAAPTGFCFSEIVAEDVDFSLFEAIICANNKMVLSAWENYATPHVELPKLPPEC